VHLFVQGVDKEGKVKTYQVTMRASSKSSDPIIETKEAGDLLAEVKSSDIYDFQYCKTSSKIIV
jgi:hypothetical protein